MQYESDITVIGGGMAGLCAAIAAARHGRTVALVQDRPVLGGNASSEVRMHIVGATRHGKRKNLRETGIIEELLLENKYRNPEHSYGLFDTLLWEKVKKEKNINLFLNTYVRDVKTENGRIVSVVGNQNTTEKEIEFISDVFIDCSGDGSVSAKAGADFMLGREAKTTFNEPNAVEKADMITMGNSIQFRSLDAGHAVPFERPDWAYDYSNEAWAKNLNWEEITSGYWWLEIGGTELNCVTDAELTRDKMLKIIFGIWDYIKNYSDKKKEAENYYLDWVSFLPAKRESRRITGDYVLTENDIIENRMFDDAIAYGGWHLDSHSPEGFYAFVNKTPQVEDRTIFFDGIYTIPYRCIYSKNVENLFLGGRIISTSHRAFSSTRVMATCAIAAQAAGIAAAMASGNKARAADVNVKSLQQALLKDGCYIPNVKNEDSNDFALKAEVSCSSYTDGNECRNVINGISRPVSNSSNMWASLPEDKNPWIMLTFDKPQRITETVITFDSNLSVEIMISLSKWHHVRQARGIPDTIVKKYTVTYIHNGSIVNEVSINGNHQRMNTIESDVVCDSIKITVNETNGCDQARICEIRVY